VTFSSWGGELGCYIHRHRIDTQWGLFHLIVFAKANTSILQLRLFAAAVIICGCSCDSNGSGGSISDSTSSSDGGNGGDGGGSSIDVFRFILCYIIEIISHACSVLPTLYCRV
jgi:hypothetical protein